MTGEVTWVCEDCGTETWGKPEGVATWHMGTCDLCGRHKPVTEPRDFGAEHSYAAHCTENTPESSENTPADEVAVTGDDPIPFADQLQWFARHITEIPTDTHLLACQRFIDGYVEYGDSLFRKTDIELKNDIDEEEADTCIYQLAADFGHELREEER